MELKYGCNCQCAELEDKKVAGAKLTLGGLVTAFNVRMSKKGNEYGQLIIEDFSGNVTFPLFGRAYEANKNKFTVGDTVLLKVNVNASKWKPDEIEANIDEVCNLSSIEGKMANAITIYLDHRFDTEEFFSQLLAFEPKERPGDLYIEIINPESRQVIKVHSRKRFPITKELVQFLEEWGVRFKVMNE